MLIFLALLVPIFCATLQGKLGDLQALDHSSTTFVLRNLNTTHRERHYVNSKGEFEFYGLDPKYRYLLSLDSDTVELPWSYLIDFKTDLENSIPVFDIHKVADGRALDTLGVSVSHPIEVTGSYRAQLVVERSNFGVFKFFLQPTVLLSLGALVAATYLPTWIQNLDPELLEELQKNQLRPDSEKVEGFDLARTIADRRSKQ